MSSLKLDQTNRVKNIRNKFEVLNEQSTVLHNVHQAKNFAIQKGQSLKSKAESRALDSIKNGNVTNGYNSKDKFGPSCNFGNRKRLKENQNIDNGNELTPTEYKSDSSSFDAQNNGDVVFEENSHGRKLSRQYSDPVKKLHRTPAFRCDKSEKLRETIKPIVVQNVENHDRLKSTREKLKMLCSKTEENIRQDEITFSKTHSGKINENSNIFESENKETPNEVANKELILKAYPELLDNADLIGDHGIPQHILDMYAKVSKPKTKCANAGKFDNLFSDSGVSSESENVMPDDLDESESPHGRKVAIKNDICDRSCVQSEIKSHQIQRSFIYPRDECEENDNFNCRKILSHTLDNAAIINNILDNGIESYVDDGVLNCPNVVDAGAASADTLRKVLNQPLPAGPPPKKPPRTFAVIPFDDDESSDISVNNDPKSRAKNTNYKHKIQHRSREESKLMLEKIENSLRGGKIISPRLKDKQAIVRDDGSIGKFDTHPSPAHLRQSSPKKHATKDKSSKKKEEIHYMCTDILGPNFVDKNNLLNSSDGSVTSSEEIRSTSSFANCLNSLNCSSNKKNSGIFYSKFGSLSNSANNSTVEICCSCNLTGTKEKCKGSNEHLNTSVRLSTFLSPNTSLDRMESDKCKICGLNERRDNNFKCHLDCTCVDKINDNSKFFVSEFGGSSNSINGPYGALLRSKSQEHIYDEPVTKIDKNIQISNTDTSPVVNNFTNKMMFTRSHTQLEDGFCKIRKSNSNNPYSDFKRKSSYSEEMSNEDTSPFVRNDFRSRTVGRIKNCEKENQYGTKVKDMLRKLEGDKNVESAMKMEDCGHDNIYKDSTVQDNARIRPISFDYASIDRINKGKTDPFSNGLLPHWQDSESTSTAELVGDRSPKHASNRAHDDESGTKNPSYDDSPREESPLSWRKPPLHDKKNFVSSAATNSRPKRPQNLELDSANASSVAGMRKSPFIPHATTDLDKQKLNNLMAEIYDTVTAVCVLNSPVMPEKSNDDNGKENLNNKDHEIEESESLQMARSLTEKRKRYVRRVTSSVSLVPSKPLGSIKYANSHIADAKDVPIDRNRNLSIKYQNPAKMSFNRIKSVFEDELGEIESDKSSPNVLNNALVSEMKPDKKLFDTCALIGINFSTNQAYIKYSYPENASLPPQIETLVFPESDNYTSNSSPTKNNSIYRKFRSDASAEDLQLYSIVLTNEEGMRSYCYCRRVVPEGLPFCLPLAYCIITTYRAPSFYYKVLEEIESHHGSSDNIVKSILTQLYQESFPKPGQSIYIKYSKMTKNERSIRNCSLYRSSVNLEEVLKSKSNREDNNSGSIGRKQSESLENILKYNENVKNLNMRRKSTDLSQKFPTILSGEKGQTMIRSLEKLYGESLNECKNSWKIENGSVRTKSPENPDKQNGTLNSSKNINVTKNISSFEISIPHLDGIFLKRPIEPRFDEDNLSVLFNSINLSALVKIFGTLLLERKVILVGDKLSKLSSCIEGLQSILYPFIWQHTLITTIPLEMRRDIFEAPVPMIAGIYICDNNCNESPNGKHAGKSQNHDVSKSNTLPNITVYNDSYQNLIEELKSANFDEGMVIDISYPKYKTSEQILRMQGDESTLLPPSLAKTLRAALQHGPCISTSGAKLDEQARKSCNILVSEAFLRFFADLLIDYKDCVNNTPASPSTVDDEHKNLIFDKELFIKKSSSKHVQYFLEWFTETAMFQNFIRQYTKSINEEVPYPDFYEVFDAKIKLLENNKSGPKVASGVTKNNYKTVMNKKMKGWRDKLRDFIH